MDSEMWPATNHIRWESSAVAKVLLFWCSFQLWSLLLSLILVYVYEHTCKKGEENLKENLPSLANGD